MTASYSILVVGTLDTKGNEVRFLRDRLAAAGLTTTVVDIGVLGPPAFQPDVPREEIARAGAKVSRSWPPPRIVVARLPPCTED